MQRVLEGLTPQKCLVYLDHVLVVGSTFEQHLENLKDVFDALKTAGLKVKPSRCFFALKSVKYLGFVISGDGLLPTPEKLEAIAEYPTPKNLQELCSFIDLASNYPRFVSGFSDIVYPLDKLLQKNRICLD